MFLGRRYRKTEISVVNLYSKLDPQRLHTPNPSDKIYTFQYFASPPPAVQVAYNTPCAPSPTSPVCSNLDIADPDQHPIHHLALVARREVYRLRHIGFVASMRRNSEICDAISGSGVR